jgi:hypothetical protein
MATTWLFSSRPNPAMGPTAAGAFRLDRVGDAEKPDAERDGSLIHGSCPCLYEINGCHVGAAMTPNPAVHRTCYGGLRPLPRTGDLALALIPAPPIERSHR